MSDTQLRKVLVRLAHENPDLREHLLPLLREAVAIEDVQGRLIQKNLVQAGDDLEYALHVAQKRFEGFLTRYRSRTSIPLHESEVQVISQMLGKLGDLLGLVSPFAYKLKKTRSFR